MPLYERCYSFVVEVSWQEITEHTYRMRKQVHAYQKQLSARDSQKTSAEFEATQILSKLREKMQIISPASVEEASLTAEKYCTRRVSVTEEFRPSL